MTNPKSSFEPLVDANTRLLILGSLPGEMSLAKRQYYAQPTNQFWRLTGAVVGRDLVGLDYEARLAALLSAGIGLWDVIKSARRSGSLDSAIADHQPNLLDELAGTLPQLRALAFNGGKSAAIGRKQMAGIEGYELIGLPSSSAAYCSISFEQKRDEWMKLRTFLA